MSTEVAKFIRNGGLAETSLDDLLGARLELDAAKIVARDPQQYGVRPGRANFLARNAGRRLNLLNRATDLARTGKAQELKHLG